MTNCSQLLFVKTSCSAFYWLRLPKTFDVPGPGREQMRNQFERGPSARTFADEGSWKGNTKFLAVQVFSIRSFPGLKSRYPTRDVLFVTNEVPAETLLKTRLLDKRNINHVGNCKEEEPGKQRN